MDKSGRGVKLITYNIPASWSRRSRGIPVLPLWAVRPVQNLSACITVHFNFTYTSNPPISRTACTEPQCLCYGALYLYRYLYSPYGTYGLYIVSVFVQRCTLTLPIRSTSNPPISRTACTEPQCLYNGALYLYRYLYSPYGPYGMYRASGPVQSCTLALHIPLLPLWAVRPVQSLSVCTTVHFTFTF